MNATESYPKISANPTIQALYVEMREAGESHNVAELLATRQTPDIRTNSTFFSGLEREIDHSPMDRQYIRLAEKAGVNTSGKRYYPRLARFPGDPMAWVNDRDDIVKRCKDRGMGLTMDGRERVKPDNDVEPEPEIGIADEIVEDRVRDKLEGCPDLLRMVKGRPDKIEKLKQQTRDEIKPHWAA